MILGIHGSVRKGYPAALEEAKALNCRALQILPYPRHHDPSPDELSSFDAARRAAGVVRLLIHSRFVPSLASSNAVLRAKSVAHLAKELSLTSSLGGDAYVLHGGAYSVDSTLDQGVELFVDSVRRARDQASYSGPLYLENVPGGGRRMGGSLEELARLHDGVKPHVAALGVCLDTAHAYAAGYDCSKAEGALQFVARAHRLMGFDAVRAFHLNDTRALLGSHREHHEHWGKGRLGNEGLGALLSRAEFDGAPAILETPKTGAGDERASLEYARAAVR